MQSREITTSSGESEHAMRAPENRWTGSHVHSHGSAKCYGWRMPPSAPHPLTIRSPRLRAFRDEHDLHVNGIASPGNLHVGRCDAEVGHVEVGIGRGSEKLA